jgi:hypothetical protein
MYKYRKIAFRLLSAFFFALVTGAAAAQEINAKVTILSNRISTQVDKRIFNTLQNQLVNLINNRKWTDQNFKTNERIEVNFIINMDRQIEPNVYGASLTVQAARPVYNTSYKSPLVNWQDNDVVFKYVEFQPVEYNENRISGNDPLASNLIAIIAFYINIILGMDFDSFAPSAGDPYYKKALFIVNNAPQGRNITGWTQFDGLRNRWWLAENFVNSRYTLFRDGVYQFYRKSLDIFYENEKQARIEMMNAVNTFFTFNATYPNTMMMQFFMQGKSDEFIQIFKNSPSDEKSRVSELLQKIDLTNAGKYREQLK